MDQLEAQRNLSDRDHDILRERMQSQQRGVLGAYFLGALGVHKIYVGRAWVCLVYIALFSFGWVWFLGGFFAALGGGEEAAAAAGGMAGVGMLCLGVLGILLLVDLFTIPRQLDKRENKIRDKLLAEMS